MSRRRHGREFGLHSLFNHYGQKLDRQKGEPFIPQHRDEPLSMVAEAGKAALSAVGDIASGVVGGLATVAEVVGGAMGGFCDVPPVDDESVADAEERRKRKLKKKLQRTPGKSRGRGI